MEDHRGKGILAGDWIKPDPALQDEEKRRYIAHETIRWLTGRLCVDAKAIAATHTDPTEFEEEIEAGRWPAARLYKVLWMLERSPLASILPKDYEARFHYVGNWAADVCLDHLNGYEAGVPASQLAVGFVTQDRLPTGKVIADYWPEVARPSLDDRIDTLQKMLFSMELRISWPTLLVVVVYMWFLVALWRT